MSLFAGLILSNLERNTRRQFEVQRNMLHHGYREMLRGEETAGAEEKASWTEEG